MIFFGGLFFVAASFVGSASREPERPELMMLFVDLRSQLPDTPPSGGLASIYGSTGFTDLILKLDAAKDDPAVKGIFIRASDAGMGSANAEEFRDALKAFQDEGKFVVAATQGSMIGGPSGYRAIATADTIWMQPGGTFSVPGVSFQSLHMASAFEKLSVTPEFVQAYEYKGAVDTFTKDGITEAGQETLQELGESVWARSIADIAADRNLSPERVRDVLQTSPFNAETAQKEGLIDEIGYPSAALEQAALQVLSPVLSDQFSFTTDDITEAREKADDEGIEFAIVNLGDYDPLPLDPDAPFIALIGAEGGIVQGYGNSGPLDAEASFAADRVVNALRAAERDDRVKAIVFRMNSGGGDATASDQIWAEVKSVRKGGKPVVVSMGPVAASGAYYAAAGADQIYALDTTITGSIGVFGGKFAIEEGLSRLGITIDEVSIGGEFADAFGPDAFTEAQFATFEAMIFETYDRFISIVAEGRDLTVAAADSAARGRVWSGEDARANGLVDARGGLVQAIDKALELSGEDTSLRPRIVRFPKSKTGFEALRSLVGVSISMESPAPGVTDLLTGQELSLLQEQVRRLKAVRAGRVELSAPLIIER